MVAINLAPFLRHGRYDTKYRKRNLEESTLLCYSRFYLASLWVAIGDNMSQNRRQLRRKKNYLAFAFTTPPGFLSKIDIDRNVSVLYMTNYNTPWSGRRWGTISDLLITTQRSHQLPSWEVSVGLELWWIITKEVGYFLLFATERS